MIYLNRQVKVSIDDLLPIIKQGLKNNQDVEIKVIGNSMKPFLKDQESIVVLRKHDGELKKHHIYFYHIGDTYILHRYIRTKNSINYFRGDAMYRYEEVDNSNVLAEVIYSISNEKKDKPYSFGNMIKLRLFLVYKTIKSVIRKIVRR